MTVQARKEEGAEERVTPLELFFDLIFVFAITQVTSLVVADPTWAGPKSAETDSGRAKTPEGAASQPKTAWAVHIQPLASDARPFAAPRRGRVRALRPT